MEDPKYATGANLVFGRKGVLVNLVVPGRSPDTIHPKRGATKEGGQSEGEHGASDRRKGRDERERDSPEAEAVSREGARREGPVELAWLLCVARCSLFAVT